MKILKKGGKMYNVIDKNTDEVLAMFDTFEEAEDYIHFEKLSDECIIEGP